MEEDRSRVFAEAVRGINCDNKKMFGCPASFVNGSMFAGVHGARLFVRLSEQERSALMDAGDARPFEPMKERVMKEHVALSETITADA
ncbi:MAG: TfoX/Sxy family protein [Spirochaetota bacterium]